MFDDDVIFFRMIIHLACVIAFLREMHVNSMICPTDSFDLNPIENL